MPRVANPPRAKHFSATTPQKPSQQSPLKIPLNDDRQEKAVRLQSRQALHDLQMNTIRAAASPVRKLNNYNRAASESPKTPRNHAARGKENVEDGGLSAVAASAMTPMKRVPILANFEEWMKMATDNKINATNSWNFALIDYFHDMSLLREGDGVNFQKASCTLDGCVKIYTSRVDSVATETGKLLSGLADSSNKKSRRSEDDEQEGENAKDEDGEDGVKKKVKKRAQRSSENTLAPSFASLQLKKMELEFSVDPLFKKASADFDEGGAKGLLLNHLTIDRNGRIVFDSSDDIEDAAADADTGKTEAQQDEEDRQNEIFVEDSNEGEDKNGIESADIDIEALGAKYFPNLARLDEQEICPSMKNFELGDPAGSTDIPFLKAPEDWRDEKQVSQPGGLGDQTGVFLEGDNVAGFDDDDEMLGGFDVESHAGFGEGGEVWASNAALEQQARAESVDFGNIRGDEQVECLGVGDFDPNSQQFVPRLQQRNSKDRNEDILSYFDYALQKNWAGPEHWRIRRIKNTNKPQAPATLRRKEKEPFEIDFNAPLDPSLAEMIYTPAPSTASISLPKAQWKSKTRNLLPNDKHFNSKQLLRLFLKPRAQMGSKRSGLGSSRPFKPQEIPEGEADEAFWARQTKTVNHESAGDDAPQGNYDANFFQDDDIGFPNGLPEEEEEFADAREVLSPENDHTDGSPGVDGALAMGESQEGAFRTQLVTQSRRLRPEYVQYARVAKKVDVRRLKEEMWRGIGSQKDSTEQNAPSDDQPAKDETTLKFTSVMNNLQQVYPKQTMDDISTSYCFICLLHLANEKGLSIDNEPSLEDLSIRKDHGAEIAEVSA